MLFQTLAQNFQSGIFRRFVFRDDRLRRNDRPMGEIVTNRFHSLQSPLRNRSSWLNRRCSCREFWWRILEVSSWLKVWYCHAAFSCLVKKSSRTFEIAEWKKSRRVATMELSIYLSLSLVAPRDRDSKMNQHELGLTIILWIMSDHSTRSIYSTDLFPLHSSRARRCISGKEHFFLNDEEEEEERRVQRSLFGCGYICRDGYVYS